ncbi:unnamed protein product, partial [Tetraodon nigroviridis]
PGGGEPDIPPPDSFPVGLISIITDRWRMSLRKRVRDGVAIVVKGMQSFRKQRGFIPEGHSDCHNPAKTPPENDTLFRHMLNVTWENNDFSFNSDGYLVNPAMIIITLDRERQWDKVTCTHTNTHTHYTQACVYCRTGRLTVISHVGGLFVKARKRGESS